MTTVTKRDIEKIAHLARIDIDESEIPQYASTLTNILGLIEQMSETNTDNITPMAHPMAELTQRLREDQITEKNQREEFQSIANETEAGVYLVPKVIEQE